MSFNGGCIGEISQQLGIQGRPMPLAQLAKEIGCTERSLRNWRDGKSEPRFEMLQRLDGCCKQHGLETQFYGSQNQHL